MTASEILRARIAGLVKQRGWSQIQLSAALGKSQAWVSRKLTGVQEFRIRDLELLAHVFDITVPELFFDTFGQWDRRSGTDRRKGHDRRQQQQILYDAHLEIDYARDRLQFPPKRTG